MSKLLVSFLVLTTAYAANASTKTICGDTDDRILSYNPKVARILKVGDPAGCTVTLIGKSCAVSAGHCTSTFGIAEFNTPISRGGRIVNSSPKDTYEVDASSIKYADRGMGNDWAVLRLKANNITNKYPGELQGHYEISGNVTAKVGDLVTITGYGRDQEPETNFAQQTNTGAIQSLNGSQMQHFADTMGGNSGSSVIHEETQEIIGIHTHGGCSTRSDSGNGSTLLAKHEAFKAAVKACLDFEANNL